MSYSLGNNNLRPWRGNTDPVGKFLICHVNAVDRNGGSKSDDARVTDGIRLRRRISVFRHHGPSEEPQWNGRLQLLSAGVFDRLQYLNTNIVMGWRYNNISLSRTVETNDRGEPRKTTENAYGRTRIKHARTERRAHYCWRPARRRGFRKCARVRLGPRCQPRTGCGRYTTAMTRVDGGYRGYGNDTTTTTTTAITATVVNNVTCKYLPVGTTTRVSDTGTGKVHLDTGVTPPPTDRRCLAEGKRGVERW